MIRTHNEDRNVVLGRDARNVTFVYERRKRRHVPRIHRVTVPVPVLSGRAGLREPITPCVTA